MNIERGERLVFFGVIHLIEFTFCVCSLFNVFSIASSCPYIIKNYDFFSISFPEYVPYGLPDTSPVL